MMFYMKGMKFWIFLFFISFIFIQSVIPQNYTFNADEGTHALIGLFYKDFLINIGNFNSFDDITKFAVNYIVKYPKLSAHYPPLYHWLLAGVFFISESLFLVRIFNIILTIVTTYVVYKLCFKVSKNNKIALISLLFFLSFSIIFFYTDKVMIDNLQILTFSLGLIYYFKIKGKRVISIGNVLILGIILTLAFLTKFFSLFLPLIILIDALFTKRNIIKYIVASGLISLLLISPYIYLYIKFGFYKLAANVALNPQIVNVEGGFAGFFNFFGFEYLNFHGTSKIDYFNFFKIFGIFIGPLVVISTFWYVWENRRNLFIVSWIVLPLILFLFFFVDVELRFLYVVMPLFSLACGTFIYKLIKRYSGKKIIFLIAAIVISQIAVNVYIKFKEPLYPIEDVIKNVKHGGNVLIMQEMPLDRGVYSSVYVLYSRLIETDGKIIRPCILQTESLSEKFIDEMGIQYIIDNNKTLNKDTQKILSLELLYEKGVDSSSIRVFKRDDYISVDCNFICVLDEKVCKNQNLFDIASLIELH